jgi:hypothetical protein
MHIDNVDNYTDMPCLYIPSYPIYQILWYYQCKLLSLPNEWGRVKLDLAWAEFAGLPGILQKCNVYKEQLDHNWFVARKPWMQTVLLPKATFRDPSIAKALLHCIMNILTVTVCFFFCLPVFWCNLHSNPFPSLPPVTKRTPTQIQKTRVRVKFWKISGWLIWFLIDSLSKTN